MSEWIRSGARLECWSRPTVQAKKAQTQCNRYELHIDDMLLPPKLTEATNEANELANESGKTHAVRPSYR